MTKWANMKLLIVVEDNLNSIAASREKVMLEAITETNRLVSLEVDINKLRPEGALIKGNGHSSGAWRWGLDIIDVISRFNNHRFNSITLRMNKDHKDYHKLQAAWALIHNIDLHYVRDSKIENAMTALRKDSFDPSAHLKNWKIKSD